MPTERRVGTGIKKTKNRARRARKTHPLARGKHITADKNTLLPVYMRDTKSGITKIIPSRKNMCEQTYVPEAVLFR